MPALLPVAVEPCASINFHIVENLRRGCLSVPPRAAAGPGALPALPGAAAGALCHVPLAGDGLEVLLMPSIKRRSRAGLELLPRQRRVRTA